jgi:ribosomal protein L16 Arg81 hydroxylase
MRVLPKFLQQTGPSDGGMLWIGPGGAFTPLHHDLTNNLFVQIVGRKRFVMAPAMALPNMYNDRHVLSEIGDVKDPSLDLTRHAKLAKVRFHEFILNPGDILFIPVGWWRQVTSLDFSVSVTYTNFLWPNLGHEGHPA